MKIKSTFSKIVQLIKQRILIKNIGDTCKISVFLSRMYFTLNGANVLTFITSHYIFNLGYNYRINFYVEAFQDQKQDLNKSSVFLSHGLSKVQRSPDVFVMFIQFIHVFNGFFGEEKSA